MKNQCSGHPATSRRSDEQLVLTAAVPGPASGLAGLWFDVAVQPGLPFDGKRGDAPAYPGALTTAGVCAGSTPPATIRLAQRTGLLRNTGPARDLQRSAACGCHVTTPATAEKCGRPAPVTNSDVDSFVAPGACCALAAGLGRVGPAMASRAPSKAAVVSSSWYR